MTAEARPGSGADTAEADHGPLHAAFIYRLGPNSMASVASFARDGLAHGDGVWIGVSAPLGNLLRQAFGSSIRSATWSSSGPGPAARSSGCTCAASVRRALAGLGLRPGRRPCRSRGLTKQGMRRGRCRSRRRNQARHRFPGRLWIRHKRPVSAPLTTAAARPGPPAGYEAVYRHRPGHCTSASRLPVAAPAFRRTPMMTEPGRGRWDG